MQLGLVLGGLGAAEESGDRTAVVRGHSFSSSSSVLQVGTGGKRGGGYLLQVRLCHPYHLGSESPVLKGQAGHHAVLLPRLLLLLLLPPCGPCRCTPC